MTALLSAPIFGAANPNIVSTFQQTLTSTSDSSTYNLGSIALGSVDPYRKTYVAIWFRGSGALSLSAATLDGNALSLVATAVANTAGGNTTYIGWFAIDSGAGSPLSANTSAALSFSLSGTASRAAASSFSVISQGASLLAIASYDSSVDDPSFSVNCPAGGAVLGAFGASDNTATDITWSGITKRDEVDVEVRAFSVASSDFGSVQSGLSVSATSSSSVSNPAAQLVVLSKD